MEPFTLTIDEATRLSGLSRSRLYEILARGELEARKAGKRTLIVAASLKSYVENLPPATFRAPQAAA
jgi:excisionase family DNA binding protein